MYERFLVDFFVERSFIYSQYIKKKVNKGILCIRRGDKFIKKKGKKKREKRKNSTFLYIFFAAQQ